MDDDLRKALGNLPKEMQEQLHMIAMEALRSTMSPEELALADSFDAWFETLHNQEKATETKGLAHGICISKWGTLLVATILKEVPGEGGGVGSALELGFGLGRQWERSQMTNAELERMLEK